MGAEPGRAARGERCGAVREGGPEGGLGGTRAGLVDGAGSRAVGAGWH